MQATGHMEECGNHNNKYRIYMDHSKKNFWKKEIVCISSSLEQQIIIRDLMQDERLCC